MLEKLSQPWPWYYSGPIIGFIVIALQWFENKPLSVFSVYRHICAAGFPDEVQYLNYEWRDEIWNMVFAGGIMLGGLLTVLFLNHPITMAMTDATLDKMTNLGIYDTRGIAPEQYFSYLGANTVPGFIQMAIAGFMIGLGSRYASGCVGAHTITGISDFQWTSMVATILMFGMAILTSNYFLPIVFKLHL